MLYAAGFPLSYSAISPEKLQLATVLLATRIEMQSDFC